MGSQLEPGPARVLPLPTCLPLPSYVRPVMTPVRLHRDRRGNTLWLLIVALAVVGTVGGGFYYWKANQGPGETKAILHRVERKDFLLAVTERGEIESAGVTEVRCEVKSKNQPGVAILRVIPEGTQVKAGDFLVQFDSSALEAERITQQIVVNTADAAVVEARNLYETALIAKEEYLDGTYVQERQLIESEMFIAEENLNRAKEYYEYSKKLASKGYINELQLEADKFAVEKSAKELDVAKTKLRVIDEFTKPKMLKQLESDILITEAKWGATKKSFDLEVARLAEIDDQIAKCTISSPKDGTVIYAQDRGWRGDNDFVVEEGTVVRENQTVFRIPDSNSMRVELTINEALIQYVKTGLPATIRPIGSEGVTLTGEVTKVNRFAEPSNWRKADVKEYKAQISIHETLPGIRPGMTASVTINCDFVPDVVQVPVQAIVEHGKKFYCLVRKDGAWELRELECGLTNSEFFVVNKGLEEGELVAMDPRHYRSEVEWPKLPPQQKETRQPSAPSDIADTEAASTDASTSHDVSGGATKSSGES
jgi:HlyD family secretion protein